MTKLKNPLLSLGAIGRLTKAITFTRRRKTDIAEKYPLSYDPKSLGQLSWRHMYQKAVALWHALSAMEKHDWESQARRRHMTGFAWFMSQALKPNPGLYLPLQGGHMVGNVTADPGVTFDGVDLSELVLDEYLPLAGGAMSGDITMTKYRILRLPAPSDAQEPLRLFEFTASISPYLYFEGARVYHNVDVETAENTPTTLAFNSERWDNDLIHSVIANTEKLVCRTAGKYIIIANVGWAVNVVGERRLQIFLNAVTVIANINQLAVTGGRNTLASLATIYDLSVGDFLTVVVLQNSGGPLNAVSRANFAPEFMMQRIG